MYTFDFKCVWNFELLGENMFRLISRVLSIIMIFSPFIRVIFLFSTKSNFYTNPGWLLSTFFQFCFPKKKTQKTKKLPDLKPLLILSPSANSYYQITIPNQPYLSIPIITARWTILRQNPKSKTILRQKG